MYLPARHRRSGRSIPIMLGVVLTTVCAASSAGAMVASRSVAACGATEAHVTPPPDLHRARPGVEQSWVTRSGSSLLLEGKPWRFAGVDAYWLGLDDNVSDAQGPAYPTHVAIDTGLRAAAQLGARVVRATTLGVSVGSPRSLEPTLGQFNDQAFGSIDYAVARARARHLRLMIPLTDEWQYYHGGKHTFTNWTGHRDLPGQSVATSAQQRAIEANLYTDPTTIAAFRVYIAHLLNHVNPLTGLRLGSDPTIAIWETGNEIWDAPTPWTEQTAAYLKSLAPQALVADGSASTGKDISETGVDAPDVDIIDAHFYPINPVQAAADAAYTAAHGKVYVIGEYPLTGTAGDDDAWLRGIAADTHVAGDLAWTLLPYLPDGAPEPHGEAYTFHNPGATPTETAWDILLSAHALAMNTGASGP